MRSHRSYAIVALLALSLAARSARAELKGKEIEYKHGDTTLLGYLAWDDAGAPGKRPGVVVVHEWMGHNDYARRRANMLAELGYVAFALDMYGKGVKAKNAQEAAQMAGRFKSDRKLMRERGLSFKQAINDAIREGLAPGREPKPFKQRTFRLGPPADERMVIKSLQYAGELENEEILRKLRMGK